ncbi:TonB-dependent receptor plug domain-containing protein [Croceivirga sp. JEA036]|nr:TonB-dependent receptor plug domain-containing protein [Croceivirga sp. JEA036]
MLVILPHLNKLSLENSAQITNRGLLILLVFFCSLPLSLAQNAVITGIVLDEAQQPIAGVNITAIPYGTVTNSDGSYLLEVIADKNLQLTFTHIGFKTITVNNLVLNTNETFEFNPVLRADAIQMANVEVSPTGDRITKGITSIAPELVRKIPAANAGVENILKLLPGVYFNNELSTQYNVRGGNFDENLIYINGIEVYRPFLIRSAQQEGLSIINPQMVSKVDFSAGGFQAKHGDRLSSVLDITYKRPTQFSVTANASFLGFGSTLETISKNKNVSSITGVRYRDNSLFVNSQQTQTTVRPRFLDAQSQFIFKVSPTLSFNVLGHVALNNYTNTPIARQTNFGTINEPKALIVYYDGKEKTQYQTEFGALKASILPKDNVKLDVIASAYHTNESELSDVIAAYQIGEVANNLGTTDFGQAVNARSIGAQLSRARNELDALILNLEHKGIIKNDSQQFRWGVKFSLEDFRDQLQEATFLDSAGFSLRPPNTAIPNNQPEEPFTGAIIPFEQVAALNYVKTDRLSAYLQWENRTQWGNHDIYYNLGIRGHYWNSRVENGNNNSHLFFSPRAQFSIKPNWEQDALFRIAVGSYKQPPFYREMRNFRGIVQPSVQEQRSTHLVIGNEYSFQWFSRPFTLISEAYYKHLNNVNPYTIEDVRIRYAAANIAKAYAYGVDLRLNGTFVPGADSWVSVGYLKTEENWNNRGYIARPTDQRLKFGVLFQDYMPTIPNLKLYLNLIYNTGVPGGSPNYEDPYEFQRRLRDYRRVDLGISYILADGNSNRPKNHWLAVFKELDVGFEIFNLFNNQNSITNTWVRDVESQNQIAVPNFLTSRLFNLKMNMRF